MRGEILNRTEVDALFTEARLHVWVTCDENHAHDASCISPKQGEHVAWVHVCRLVETVRELDRRLRAVKGLAP